MNLNRFTKSLLETFVPSKAKSNSSEYNPYDFIVSMPGETPWAHTEEYITALQIAEEFEQLTEQEERMDFWDRHFSVFGPAGIIVFDTHKKVYWPYYGRTEDQLFDDLDGDDERYKAVVILPNDIEEFWMFVHWCIEKYNDVEGFTIMGEEYYWKQIGKNLMPKEFLTKLLSAAEAHRDHIGPLENHWGVSSITNEKAKDYFFYYGNKDATDGDNGGALGSGLNLNSVFSKIITCPLSDYGEIFLQYYNGWNTAEMVALLRQQKERMDKGEDIRFPAINDNNQDPLTEYGADLQESYIKDTIVIDPITTTQTAPNQSQPVSTPFAANEKDQPQFIFIAKQNRPTVERQLGFGLDGVNKARLKALIELTSPDDKIHTKTTAKVLADYFRQVYHAGDINNIDYIKDEIGDWLAHWFVKPNGKPYEAQTFKDYLQMTDSNSKVSQDKMTKKIIYKPLRS